MPRGHGGNYHHRHHHHNHSDGVGVGGHHHDLYDYGWGFRPSYGRGMSKASIKCYIITGVVLLNVAVIFLLFGALCIAGVLSGFERYIGVPLLGVGIGCLATSLTLLITKRKAAKRQGEASSAQAIDQVDGLSATNPAIDSEAFPATPGPPPPYEPAAQTFQPPPYSWTSPAPFDGAPAYSVQGPYSGFQYTSFPDLEKENSNPSAYPLVT